MRGTLRIFLQNYYSYNLYLVILLQALTAVAGNMSESKDRLRVAVRVRPFSQREVARGCKRIVDMDGVTTSLTHPTDLADRKSFSFDHSYWSFDGFSEDQTSGRNVADPSHPRGHQYCDQERLFGDVGRVMLADTFEGYNTTLFSYGQTGSGKSYSVIGYGSNEGIIPQFCHEIFRAIDENSYTSPVDPIQFEVHLSMLEIYNENVYDLLTPSKTDKGLKVREHPKKGFYADGLSNFVVTSYADIERLIKHGTLNRTVVATNMNATSSRSHTIVSIGLDQKRTTQIGEVTITSVVNIVDLAGSERVSKAGTGNTSGERFREGVAINQSLQCLGHCIHALAESSSASSSNFPMNSHSKNQRIPFRDSVLTKLLMNALGGNSKTIMVASISPADIHYEETLSTLRYADRAKQIRTRATVNEKPIEKIVRELKGENQRIKAALTRGNIDPQWVKTVVNGRQSNPKTLKDTKKKWEDELRAQVTENEREIQRIRSPKPKELPKADEVVTDMLFESKRNHEGGGPYLQNVNMDPLLDGRWIHYLKRGTTLIGKAQPSISGIEMIGPGMQQNHAEISFHENNDVALHSLTENGRVLVNGVPIKPRVETVLQPNDRLVFGATQMWLFRNPALVDQAGVSDSPMINYDFILHEMATKSGMDILSSSSDGKDSLQEELVAVLPSVEEANEISAELNKPVKFEIVLVAPQIYNNPAEKMVPSQVYVKMKNLDHGTEYIWSKEKFFTRFDFMRELYRHHQMEINGEEEDGREIRITDDRDPFSESSDAVVIIGMTRIVLRSLAYLVEMQDHVPITDLRGIKIGVMKIALVPCADSLGHQLQEDDLVDSSDQLIGKNLFFKFHIIGCRNLPPKFRDLHCKYRFYGDKDDSKTKMYPYSSNLQFNHSRILSYEPVTREFVDYLNHGSVVVEVLGRHIIEQNHPFNNSYPTPHLVDSREFLDEEDQGVLSRTGEIMAQKPSINNFESAFKSVDGRKQELLAELQLVKRTHVRLQQRLDFIRQMTDRCLLTGQESIPTALLDAMLNANGSEQARRIVQQLETGEDGDEWVDWNVTNQPKEHRSSVCVIS
ncbi:kinesin-like protein KIF28P isoform X5 [Daphnia pulex]|uniref:kinesin-like protein KIF28P isoform X5 n=1 Tax=Daphnia pulex TaxID=6669 RepID=UPI001EDD0E31|nr:kinesin-like protein KIF28P isoform X5 [Daphnia pulex]